MVIHKNLYGVETRFSTISLPLVNNTLEKCIGVIRISSYQAADEEIIWAYEPVYDLCPYIEPVSDYSVGGSRDEGFKEQDSLDDK